MGRQMKDSGIEWIGMIPEDWNVIKNKYNFELNKEIVGDEWENTQLLSLTKSGIKRINDGEQSGKVPMSYSTYQKVKRNEIVMCLFDLDVSAVFSGLSPFDGMISPAYKCFKCGAHIIPKYIDYYFKTVFVDRKYKRYSKNVRFSLGTEEFMNLSIIVPSLEEQQKIADFLDEKVGEIDNVIETTKATIEDYKKYKQSVITEAVTKGLNPDVEMKDSGIEWFGKIPKEWQILKISYITNNISDIDHYMPEDSDTENKVPYIMIGDLKDKTSNIAFDNCKQVSYEDFCRLSVKSKPELGDIIFARYATIGTVCYVDVEKDILVSYACLTVKPKENVNGSYMYYYFKSLTFLEDVSQYINTNTQGNVGKESLLKTKITLPSLNEQREIVEYLDEKCTEIDNLISAKEQLIADMESYKKSLIYEYVTGKKEVSNNE